MQAIEKWMRDAARELRIKIHAMTGPPGTANDPSSPANSKWLDQVTSDDARTIAKYAPSDRCLEPAGHLIAGASWFTCCLAKGHQGEHMQGGTCFAHGAYVGKQCPAWPNCIPEVTHGQ